MVGRVRIDCAAWPVVVFDCEGRLNDPEIAAHLREYRELLDRNEPYVVLMDTRRLEIGPTSTRRTYAAFLSDNKADLKRLCRMCVFCTTSRLMMGAITAVLWIVPLPFPYKVFASYEEGLAWLRTLT